LQRAANLFAFLGLISEIAGTFLGALHSILLQKKNKDKNLFLQRVTLFKTDLKVILKWYTQKRLKEAEKLIEDKERSGMRRGASRDGEEGTGINQGISRGDEEESGTRQGASRGSEAESGGASTEEGPGIREVSRGDEEGSGMRQRISITDHAIFKNINSVIIQGSTFAMSTAPALIGDKPDSEDRKERAQRVKRFFQEIHLILVTSILHQ